MKNKKLWLKLGIFALSVGGFGLSFASAALFNIASEAFNGNGAGTLVYATKNIIPIHFADNGNDFGGFMYISNMGDISRTDVDDPSGGSEGDPENVSQTEVKDIYYIGTGGNPLYECSAMVRGFYYNSERGERLWPLNEKSSLDSKLSTTGGIYTLCRATGYAQFACNTKGRVYKDGEGCVCYKDAEEVDGICPLDCGEGATEDPECIRIKNLSEEDPEILMKRLGEEYPIVDGFFGQVEHTFSGQTFGLVMGTTYKKYGKWYDIEKGGNSPAKLQSSFILWNKRIPVGFVYDYNGGLGFAGCELIEKGTTTIKKTLKSLVGSGNEGKLEGLFEQDGQKLKPKEGPIGSGLNCDKIGSMGDSLINLLIEGLVGMNRTSDYKKVGAQSDTKMQYFSSSDINSATLLNYAKQRSEILCRGKWQKDTNNYTHKFGNSEVVCLDFPAKSTVGSDISKWTKDNGKTLIVKNADVIVDPFIDSEDSTYYDMFINGGDLIVNETGSTAKFVFNVGGFIVQKEVADYRSEVGDAIDAGRPYTGNLAAEASLIRGNFVVDGKIKGLNNDSKLFNKYFIYGKFTTRDSFDDLEKTFMWSCDTDNGISSDDSYCPVSYESEGYYNPYYNVSLVVIDQNYDSPLFK